MTMSRTIKTRESVTVIKTADHRRDLKHYLKNNSIRYRSSANREEENEKQNSEIYTATETVQQAWKKTAISSLRRMQRDRFTSKKSCLRDSKEEDTFVFPDHKNSSSGAKVYQKRMLHNTANGYIEKKLKSRTNPAGLLSHWQNGQNFRAGGVRRIGNAISSLTCTASGAVTIILLAIFFGVFSVFTNTTVVAEGVAVPEASLQPDFTNEEAWGLNNPYTRAGYIGQCTWFAWGRFYEIYGYDPGFRGDGWNCAAQLVAAHPDKFELSYIPSAGAVFSAIGRNHVGIVISVDENEITIQEGNLDGRSNLFVEAISDWHEITYPVWKLTAINGGVVYACPG